jgi:hypothetical protein
LQKRQRAIGFRLASASVEGGRDRFAIAFHGKAGVLEAGNISALSAGLAVCRRYRFSSKAAVGPSPDSVLLPTRKEKRSGRTEGRAKIAAFARHRGRPLWLRVALLEAAR